MNIWRIISICCRNFQHGWNQVSTYSLKYCVTRILVIISNKTKISELPKITLVEVRCHRQTFSFISKMIWNHLSYDNPQEQLSIGECFLFIARKFLVLTMVMNILWLIICLPGSRKANCDVLDSQRGDELYHPI